jgi:hypothetical protein
VAFCAALTAAACGNEGNGTFVGADSGSEAGDAGGSGGGAAAGGSGGSTGGQGGTGGGGEAGAPAGGSDAGDATGGAGGSVPDGSGGTAADQCSPTNGSVEVCDDIDNDCDGEVDDLVDWTTIRACGSCELRCDSCPTDGTPCDIPLFVTDPSCVPPGILDGTTKGTCSWTQCADDYWDVDQNAANGCEYFCQHNPTRDPNKLDIGGTFPGEAKGCGFDDDCDGQTDEDVNLCTDVDNCGTCGRMCILNNASSTCVTTAVAGEPCIGGATGNTKCQIVQCSAGWHDADGIAANGCEYQCVITNGGVEICDGLDNDCDNKLDNADPEIENSEVGDSCYGGPGGTAVTQAQAQGVCADAAHAGVRKCISGAIACCDVESNKIASTDPQLPSTGLRNGICQATTGAQVVFPGDLLETCNNQDDDCDGTKDDTPIDEGSTCGSSVGSCVAGTVVCDSVNKPTCSGSDCLACVGATLPKSETCNGEDDNCDGVTDGTLPTTIPISCVSAANCPAGQLCMTRTTAADKVCAVPACP